MEQIENLIEEALKTLSVMKRTFEEIDDNEFSPEERLQKKVKALKEYSDQQPKQRTPGWYALRKLRITASDVASCLKKNFVVCEDYIRDYHLGNNFNKSNLQFCNPYSNERDFILKKNGYGKFEGNVATSWGNKYETPASRFYEYLSGENMMEFGLILHPTIDWLACSPDGISDNGVMLEIKCPYKRNINGVPPIYYWIQCQIQLEVCDLERCDFLECQIEPITLAEFCGSSASLDKTCLLDTDDEENEGITTSYDTTPSLEGLCTFIKNTAEGKVEETRMIRNKGLLVNFKKNDTYFYPPKKYQTYSEIMSWAEKKCEKYKKLDPQIEYYQVKSYTLHPIYRNKKWFEAIKPMLERTWDKVQNFKVEDYQKELEEKKEKTTVDLSFKVLDECQL